MWKILTSWVRRVDFFWVLIVPIFVFVVTVLFEDWIAGLLGTLGISIPNILQWTITHPLESAFAIFFLTLSFLMLLAYKQARDERDEIDISLVTEQRHENTLASIRVANNRIDRSVFCTPYLKRIDWEIKPGEMVDIKEKINKYNLELSWEGGSDTPEVEIKPSQIEIINVARYINNVVQFTFYGADPDHPSGKFRIHVEVLCRKDLEFHHYFHRHFFGCLEVYGQPGAPLSSIRIWGCEDVDEWKKESGIKE